VNLVGVHRVTLYPSDIGFDLKDRWALPLGPLYDTNTSMDPTSAPTTPIRVADVLPLLRLAAGLPATAPGPADPFSPASGPQTLSSLDRTAWLAWSIAGLHLFDAADLPTLRQVTQQARHVLLTVALERCEGNISRMARWLGSSRRVVREALRSAGLYQDLRPAASPDRAAAPVPAAAVNDARSAW